MLGDALRALLSGAFGSWYAFGSGTLVRATPLILTGLAVAIAFRAGVFNIGAEGQFLVGAIAATAAALTLHALPAVALVPLALVAGALAGAAWAWIAAVLRRAISRARSDQHDHAELRRGLPRVVSRARAAAGADAHLSADG